ncbi:MAG: ABC transporter ATP-binding protein [Coprobacillus sp.]
MIEIKNVSKEYKHVKALNDVSFQFETGKIYGLLGRNGAGKSTLLKIISNRIFASEGHVYVDGENAQENIKIRDKLYCMTEENLYPNLKVKDIFKWTDEFYDNFDIEKAYDYAGKFELDTQKKMNSLSTGYRSICKLVIALSFNMPYIIFDEPVLGLDANHRELFYKLLLQTYDEDKTIIIATHLIEEVANLIEDVVIIDKGQILLQDSVERIMSQGYSVSGNAKDVDEYCHNEKVIGIDELGGMKVAYIMGDVKKEELHDKLQISSMNLQKLFVKLTESGCY